MELLDSHAQWLEAALQGTSVAPYNALPLYMHPAAQAELAKFTATYVAKLLIALSEYVHGCCNKACSYEE